MKYYCFYQSPIGILTLGCNDNALTGLWIQNEKYYPNLEDAAEAPSHPVFEDIIKWLDSYFSGEKPDTSTLCLEPQITPFQKRVWQALRQILYGETVSYKELASRVGCENGYRAIGGAVGHNPISIIVPCHRVIGASGGLTGFAGGLSAKQWLLSHEANTK